MIYEAITRVTCYTSPPPPPTAFDVTEPRLRIFTFGAIEKNVLTTITRNVLKAKRTFDRNHASYKELFHYFIDVAVIFVNLACLFITGQR